MVSGVQAVRAVYLAAAAVATDLLGHPAVADRWDRSSALDGLSVGGLAAHLARSVLQVEQFLDGPVGLADPAALVSAVDYYARLEGTSVAASPLNTGVRRRSAQTAAQGPAAVAAEAGRCLRRLRERLPAEPAQRRVAVLHRPGEELLLDEYLATRCVELSVHTEDLARSVDAQVQPPMPAVDVAVDVLVAAARRRHGDRAVLRALTRREHDHIQALRVL